MGRIRTILYGLILVALLAAGCAPQAQKFAIVAHGEPAKGPQIANQVTLALRSGSSYETLVADLPGDAASELQKALKEGEPGIYLLIYAGPQPSAGISVEIREITHAVVDGREQLTVRWELVFPGDDSAAAAVITHPWILARVANTSAEMPDVRFVKVES